MSRICWDFTQVLTGHMVYREIRGREDIPICADESVFGNTDALELVRRNAADYLKIKLRKSGEIGIA